MSRWSEIADLVWLDTFQTAAPTIVVEVSYKEGVIVGALIAVCCILICSIILCCRVQKERQRHNYHNSGRRYSGFFAHFPCFGTRNTGQGNSPRKLHNGHVINGDSKTGTGTSEEVLTLLPLNPKIDSKGGVNGVQPRCSKLAFAPPSQLDSEKTVRRINRLFQFFIYRRFRRRH